MSAPLVSVVTPTWGRHDLLLSRCIPSVQAQTYSNIEHVIVADGPDEELRALIAQLTELTHPIRYLELDEHHLPPNYGHYARQHGIDMANGDYITYNDDDDALRPEHCSLMAAALTDNPHAGFAVSRMMSHSGENDFAIGWGPLACGNVGTPMIAHRRDILAQGAWGPPSIVEDWEAVQKWLDAGVPYVNVDAETSDVWPSLFRGESKC